MNGYYNHNYVILFALQDMNIFLFVLLTAMCSELTDVASRDYFRELTEEQKIGFDEVDLALVDSLNAEQKAGFDQIMAHVNSGKGQVFFVDGPGGTGKTYLYRALLAKVRSMNLIVVATATSGIAASIMPGGRTAHSRFKIPIKLGDNSICNFTNKAGQPCCYVKQL